MSTQYGGLAGVIIAALPTAKNISSTTNATPIVVTTAVAHGILTGDYVLVVGADDPGANGVWETGTVTATTLVLEGTVGTLVGGANGTVLRLNFGATYAIPSDGDDFDAAAFNAAYEALGDRTAYLMMRDAIKKSDIQIFTSSGTWTKPPNAGLWADLIAVGGGAGGGSGARQPAGTATSGGAGGGGGGVTHRHLRLTLLGATETVTRGAGGAGAPATTTNGTNGLQGTNGGATTIGSLLIARGGIGGLGATTAPGSIGPSNGGAGDFFGGAGGIATTGAAGTSAPSTNEGAGGGGGGGGIDAGGVAYAGGPGGLNAGTQGTQAAGGVVPGGNGTAGTASIADNPGHGGGGGAGSAVGVAGTGGAGGTYGGGGGGGGSSLDGSNSGGGGAGANGIAIIITTQ